MHRTVGPVLAASLLAVFACALPAFADEDAALHHHVTDSSPFDVMSSDSLCVDGDTLSFYNSSCPAPVWVEVDLGSDMSLSLVRLIPRMAPEGNMSITIYGRTSGGVTYTLATWSGTAREHRAINVPIFVRIPVRYLNVNVDSSVSRVSWYALQAYAATGLTPATNDTWGRLKALYR